MDWKDWINQELPKEGGVWPQDRQAVEREHLRRKLETYHHRPHPEVPGVVFGGIIGFRDQQIFYALVEENRRLRRRLQEAGLDGPAYGIDEYHFGPANPVELDLLSSELRRFAERAPITTEQNTFMRLLSDYVDAVGDLFQERGWQDGPGLP